MSLNDNKSGADMRWEVPNNESYSQSYGESEPDIICGKIRTNTWYTLSDEEIYFQSMIIGPMSKDEYIRMKKAEAYAHMMKFRMRLKGIEYGIQIEDCKM